MSRLGGPAGLMLLAACATMPVDVPSGATVQKSAQDLLTDPTLAEFEPTPSSHKVTVNYDPFDELLDEIVLLAGPSLRRPAGPRRAFSGTRFVYGHTSPYRLEGNKVLFSQMNAERKAEIAELTASLVAFGNKVKVPNLPRDEQLAYWLNLHNMLVISTIASNYPAMEPRKIQIGPAKTPLQDAPLAVIDGVPLSLRAIRIGIVYRFWGDPRVMYGFFHGDLASPNIAHKAYRPSNLSQQLGLSAAEFINSLRGVRRDRVGMVVSPVYKEALGSLFTDWPEDLRMHLRNFSDREVDIILDETESVTYSRREYRTADLVGGRPHSPMQQIVGASYGPSRPVGDTSYQKPYSKPFPKSTPAFNFMIGEFSEKFQELKRMKRRTGKGYVEIQDLPVGPQDDEVEEEEKTDE